MSSVSPVVRLLHDDGVAVVEIDNPPVNATSHEVRSQMRAVLEAALADPAVRAIVIAGAGRTFIAGADIREQGKPPKPPVIGDNCALIEASDKPVVAAIHGVALGGGFEVALASHARIASADAKVGLPEVTLGIIPGAGGTQRAPRLCGVPAAIDLVTSGKPLPASRALALGLIDRIAESDPRREAIAYARELAGKPIRRTGALAVPPFDRADAEKTITAVEKKARGQISPGKAARAVLFSADYGIDEGLARERAIYLDLVGSDQAAALRHVFFAEREAAKVPGLKGIKPRDVSTIGIAGAGTMGSGITVAALDAGYRVIVVEQNDEAADAGRSRIAGLYDRAIKSKRIGEADKAERLGRLTVSADRTAFAPADLVIEAVFDEMTVKEELFKALDEIVRPDTILATNTSYLNPDAIAAVTKDPSRIVGIHFFSPAHVMRLLEVVNAAKTAPDVLATALATAKKLRKLAVVAGVCEGFIGNRIYARYRQQTEFMLEDGALPQEVDAAVEAYGFPMGPFAVNDLSGLDIAWARRKRLAATRDARERYVPIADRLCEMGRLGQKTGAGWYRYVEGTRTVDPAVTTLIEEASRVKAIARRIIPAAEIQARVLAAMVNEGANILAEGIALRASDIDLVLINGYGYPAWRGGPMFEADRMGLDNVLAEVRRTAARDGVGWEPSPLLVELAESGKTFASLAEPS
ncbi:MAG TPA: 3-hydroxyacyl-CoA dehydrogenase NAD-binding domain-containing protein [Pseudolabrys sp.]|nr:3-hydroxyacyl-CoA dehydrogenase NAD-binding domain-containing protein [Pseudolabrys sp.]